MLLPADAGIVQRETAIPGLGALLDPDEFAVVLGDTLCGGGVNAVRLVYVRYKPGTSCLAAYKVDTGGECVDIYARALPRDDMNQLRKVVPDIGGVILEDRAVAVFGFPNDGQLGALSLLADDEARVRLFSEILPERPDLWESTLEAIRYKPEHRFVGRLMNGERSQATVKVYTSPNYRRAKNSAAVLASRGPLWVAAQLARRNRHNLLVFDWLEGRLLREILQQAEPELETVRMAGAALAELHSLDAGRLVGLTRNREVAKLRKVVAEVGYLCPHLARRVGELVNKIASLLCREPEMNRFIHGDFKSDQVIIDDDRAAIFDYDSLASGDPSTDIGKFLAHLEIDKLRGDLPDGRLETIKDVLLQGYQSATRRDLPPRIELYTAAGLLKNTRRCFRTHQPDWPEAIEAILERAEVIAGTLGGG